MLRLFALVSLLVLPLFAKPVAASDAEIEHLLRYVASLDGAVFVRNGSEHDCKAAESHLRLKWDRQRDKISTAEKFIALCATRSSVSGDAYVIRFADGQRAPAAEVLRKELSRLRQR